MKAVSARDVRQFSDIPNIGPAMVRDFELLGLSSPNDLRGKDPFQLYKAMCRIRGVRQDPCVLDTYMAAVYFMNGAPASPWWHYTKQRKEAYPDL